MGVKGNLLPRSLHWWSAEQSSSCVSPHESNEKCVEMSLSRTEWDVHEIWSWSQAGLKFYRNKIFLKKSWMIQVFWSFITISNLLKKSSSFAHTNPLTTSWITAIRVLIHVPLRLMIQEMSAEEGNQSCRGVYSPVKWVERIFSAFFRFAPRVFKLPFGVWLCLHKSLLFLLVRLFFFLFSPRHEKNIIIIVVEARGRRKNQTRLESGF